MDLTSNSTILVFFLADSSGKPSECIYLGHIAHTSIHERKYGSPGIPWAPKSWSFSLLRPDGFCALQCIHLHRHISSYALLALDAFGTSGLRQDARKFSSKNSFALEHMSRRQNQLFTPGAKI